MANLGRGDNVDETSLATATAAIITARWGGPARRAQTSGLDRRGDDPGSAAHNGDATSGAASGAMPGVTGHGANGHATFGHTTNGHPGSGFGNGSGYADPNGYGDPNGPGGNGPEPAGYAASYGSAGLAPANAGARATATVERPASPGPETYRGATPPPMFTPATVAPMSAAPMSGTPMSAAPMSADPMSPAPDPYLAAAEAYAPPPERFAAFVPPEQPARSEPYPAGDGFAPAEAPGAGFAYPDPSSSGPESYPEYQPAEPAGPHPFPGPEPGLFTPTVPVPRAPAAADALEAPGFSAFAPADDFAGSVMSGLAFPEPFVPEPYDPAAFALPSYGTDGATVNGHTPVGEPSAHSSNGHGASGHNGNGHGLNGHSVNGYGAGGFDPAREPMPERQEAGRARVPAGRVTSFDPLDINTEPMLPRRVPSKPDVPDVFLPNDPADDGFELARIASYLREEKVDETDTRPDGFDVDRVLSAVRGVPGVSDAQLRWNTGYGHTLRVEFELGANEQEVTRAVAGMLRESMGLAAHPGSLMPGLPAPRWGGDENTLERSRRGAPPASASGGRVVPGPGLVSNVLAGPALGHPGLGPAGAVTGPRPGPRPAEPVQGPRGEGPARSAPRGDGTRVVIDHVQVTTLGVDASIEVRLTVSGGSASGTVAKGTGQGPAVDAYLLRLAASAAGDAIDQLLIDPASGSQRGRCFIEHVAVVPFGSIEVAVVVALLMSGSEAAQVSGSAIVTGDPRQAVVRATLSAVNRRLESLLA